MILVHDEGHRPALGGDLETQSSRKRSATAKPFAGLQAGRRCTPDVPGPLPVLQAQPRQEDLGEYSRRHT